VWALARFRRLDGLVFCRRRKPPLPGCENHRNCANCPRYAYQWHYRVTSHLAQPRYTQLSLFTAEGGGA
jgi:hypothetical protein